MHLRDFAITTMSKAKQDKDTAPLPVPLPPNDVVRKVSLPAVPHHYYQEDEAENDNKWNLVKSLVSMSLPKSPNRAKDSPGLYKSKWALLRAIIVPFRKIHRGGNETIHSKEQRLQMMQKFLDEKVQVSRGKFRMMNMFEQLIKLKEAEKEVNADRLKLEAMIQESRPERAGRFGPIIRQEPKDMIDFSMQVKRKYIDLSQISSKKASIATTLSSRSDIVKTLRQIKKEDSNRLHASDELEPVIESDSQMSSELVTSKAFDKKRTAKIAWSENKQVFDLADTSPRISGDRWGQVKVTISTVNSARKSRPPSQISPKSDTITGSYLERRIKTKLISISPVANTSDFDAGNAKSNHDTILPYVVTDQNNNIRRKSSTTSATSSQNLSITREKDSFEARERRRRTEYRILKEIEEIGDSEVETVIKRKNIQFKDLKLWKMRQKYFQLLQRERERWKNEGRRYLMRERRRQALKRHHVIREFDRQLQLDQRLSTRSFSYFPPL